jgi:hypothetical protein
VGQNSLCHVLNVVTPSPLKVIVNRSAVPSDTSVVHHVYIVFENDMIELRLIPIPLRTLIPRVTIPRDHFRIKGETPLIPRI